MGESSKIGVLAIIGPGILVAATGVGAGDLATASLSGSEVGIAVLWAVAVGACLKYVLNEGLARWQLATDQTLLEGAIDKFGLAVAWLFLPYLLVWSFLVGSALMSACGVTMHAIVPVFAEAETGKVVFGALHGALGLVLVLIGGFKLFEKLMGVCIGAMFVTVVVTAGVLWPGTGVVFRGLFVPDPATLQGGNLSWTIALMGGVGGTLTVLCYGYWIREKGRQGEKALKICRIDLGVAYAMTAVFGIAMVIIGSQIRVDSRGAFLLVDLANHLEGALGPAGKWAFLLGAWGAVFSSLLGVWQAVPFLFADFWTQTRRRRACGPEESPGGPVDTDSFAYRGYLFAIALVPMLGLFGSFKAVAKYYAVVGACFMPPLALALIILNGRSAWVGERLRNRWPTVFVLVAALGFFSWLLWRAVLPLFG